MYVWEKEPIKQSLVPQSALPEPVEAPQMEPALNEGVERELVSEAGPVVETGAETALTFEELTVAEEIFRAVSEIESVGEDERETMEVSDSTIAESMVEGRHETA